MHSSRLYRAACEEALSERPVAAGRLVPLLSRKTDLPGAYRAALGSCPVRGADAAASPSTDAYLQVLADGLKLVDAIKDIRTALHDQPTRLSKVHRSRR